MLGLRYAPPSPRAVSLLALAAAVLSGCAALNPLQGVQPGPDAAWSRPPAQAAARPATSASRPDRTEEHAERRPSARTRAAAQAVAAAARRAGRTEDEDAPPVILAANTGETASVPRRLAGNAALAAHLRTEGERWIGTPYRYGGESRAGMDCSGFTRTLMRDALGVELTRSTATMVYEGEQVDKDDLLPGDLVFFRRGGTRHVGVYLGANEFIHASSSNGVIVSRLDEDYYERHYWTARRVLDSPQHVLQPASTGSLPETPSEPASAADAPDEDDPRAAW